LAILSLQIVLHVQCVSTYTTYCRNKFYTPKPNGLLVTVMITKVKNSRGRHDITLPYKKYYFTKFSCFSQDCHDISFRTPKRGVASIPLALRLHTFAVLCDSVCDKYKELC